MISAPEWMDVLLARWPEVNQVFKPPIVSWSLIPLPSLSKCSSVCLWAVNLFRFIEFVILFTWTSGVWSNSIWLGRVRSPQDFHHQQALNANDLSALTTAVLYSVIQAATWMLKCSYGSVLIRRSRASTCAPALGGVSVMYAWISAADETLCIQSLVFNKFLVLEILV